ncbi:zeta toxin family protein [Kribbella sp. CA-247076]|uniref:zeta toxin family protein n=1 Tax=Kribbella sp. CA-247076 TaxID=3239941 RepID=UPI003D8A8B50
MTELALTPAEAAAVVAQRLAELTPLRSPDRSPGVRPTAVLIGGQPGAGKSTTQDLVQRALGAETTASYDFDDHAVAHPRYRALLGERGIDAHRDVHESLPPELHRRCLEHLTRGETQYDVVASAPLSWEEGAKPWIDHFADDGYRVAVVYVATNDANSLLGVANRYQQSVDDQGIGRWVAPRLHDSAYRGVPDTAHALESQAYVDDVYVVNRDGNVLYENHRKADGTMERPPGAREAIIAERNRPPTPAEREHFREVAMSLLRHEPNLAEPVRDVVSEAMTREVARAAPEQHDRVPSAEDRIDHQVAALRHVTGSGIAPPHDIGPSSEAAARSEAGRASGGRSIDGGPRNL